MKKGFKVTDVNRTKKIGIAAENLEDLIQKSQKKFSVSVNCALEYRLCVAEDGTLVDDDDYLISLPAQTLLVLIKNNEKMMTDFEFYYNIIKSTKQEYLETGNAAKDFLNTNIKEKFRVFQKYIAMADNSRALLSDRKEDAPWFEGLDPSEKTKEQSLGKRAKDRMRAYYYKTKTALQSSDLYVHSKNSNHKTIIDDFLLQLRKTLESTKYNEAYFNRKAAKNIRMCNDNGLFECGGVWNISVCAYGGEHIINPYRSREERIIFQTWNLDHRIELSRSIIPKILEAIQSVGKKKVSCSNCERSVSEGFIEADRYYLEIFTRKNLKLVHIVCHCKRKHDAETDIYTLCKKCLGSQTITED